MRNTSLRVLDLTGNRITNNGGRDIGFALRSNTFIKKVYLNNNNLNDLAGQFLLESVRINSGILALDLQFNTINFKIIHQIQE